MSLAFSLSMMFLILAMTMIIILIIYLLFWKPKVSATACQANNNCGITEVCQAGFCTEIICNNDSECNGNGLCLNSYCTPFTCQIGNNCPTGTACVNGECIRVGNPCQINADCFNLSCMNQICVQCLSNSNCPLGQGCFNQVCRYPYAGETGANQINYPSPAQGNGIINAPPGYFCSGTVCSDTGTTGPISCTGTTGLVGLCPSTCPFCVNSVCRCTSGENTEQCRTNGDCSSGLCANGVCVPIGGECITNHSITGTTGMCPVAKPYCVNGVCSLASLGAICGATGMPYDLCNNPQALGVTGATGTNPTGMGFFCINGFCQESPGELNEQCTPGSCGFIENGILVCTPVETPTIPEMRCLVTR